MKKTKKQVFRVGDTVRIVTPEFFVRVGYPFNKEYAIENLITREEKEILQKLINYSEFPYFDGQKSTKNKKIYFKMLNLLAYQKLITNSFGGPERQIFTERKENLKGRELRILSKKVVKTGIRRYESEHNEWSGENYGWYYLSQEKSHVLLEIDVYTEEGDLAIGPFLWIEEKNVEKVKK